MVVIITTTGPTYADMMLLHQEKLNNLEALGRPQTNKEIALQTENVPPPFKVNIHSVSATIYNYGNMPMYTTAVCCEPVVEEKEEEKEENGEYSSGYTPEVRVS